MVTKCYEGYIGHSGYDNDEPCRVLVFGSNTSGIHGAGTAKIAREHWGALLGISHGPTGRAYALCTTDLESREKYPLGLIVGNIQRFYEYARTHFGTLFLVAYTNDGRPLLCGHSIQDMADCFVKAGDIPRNVVFERRFASLMFGEHFANSLEAIEVA